MLPWKPTLHQVNILYNIEKTLLFCILVHKEPPARKASLSIKHFGCYIKRKEELTYGNKYQEVNYQGTATLHFEEIL